MQSLHDPEGDLLDAGRPLRLPDHGHAGKADRGSDSAAKQATKGLQPTTVRTIATSVHSPAVHLATAKRNALQLIGAGFHYTRASIIEFYVPHPTSL